MEEACAVPVDGTGELNERAIVSAFDGESQNYVGRGVATKMSHFCCSARIQFPYTPRIPLFTSDAEDSRRLIISLAHTHTHTRTDQWRPPHSRTRGRAPSPSRAQCRWPVRPFCVARYPPSDPLCDCVLLPCLQYEARCMSLM